MSAAGTLERLVLSAIRQPTQVAVQGGGSEAMDLVKKIIANTAGRMQGKAYALGREAAAANPELTAEKVAEEAARHRTQSEVYKAQQQAAVQKSSIGKWGIAGMGAASGLVFGAGAAALKVALTAVDLAVRAVTLNRVKSDLRKRVSIIGTAKWTAVGGLAAGGGLAYISKKAAEGITQMRHAAIERAHELGMRDAVAARATSATTQQRSEAAVAPVVMPSPAPPPLKQQAQANSTQRDIDETRAALVKNQAAPAPAQQPASSPPAAAAAYNPRRPRYGEKQQDATNQAADAVLSNAQAAVDASPFQSLRKEEDLAGAKLMASIANQLAGIKNTSGISGGENTSIDVAAKGQKFEGIEEKQKPNSRA